MDVFKRSSVFFFGLAVSFGEQFLQLFDRYFFTTNTLAVILTLRVECLNQNLKFVFFALGLCNPTLGIFDFGGALLGTHGQLFELGAPVGQITLKRRHPGIDLGTLLLLDLESFFFFDHAESVRLKPGLLCSNSHLSITETPLQNIVLGFLNLFDGSYAQDLSGSSMQLKPSLLVPKFFITLGLFSLTTQGVELALQFRNNIINTQKILLRGIQPPLSRLLPSLELGNTRDFFNQPTTVFGPRVNDITNAPLLNNRIGSRPHARAQKEVGNIPEPDRCFIDQIFTATISVQPPRH